MLYLITPPLFNLFEFRLSLQTALEVGKIAYVQLRLKETSPQALDRASLVLGPIVRKYRVPFLLNDDPVRALATGCDGVHLGQTDMPYRQARNLLGTERTIGITCHDSLDLGLAAAANGADYVAFGAFFPTRTKPSSYAPEPTLLRQWKRLSTTPCVAIGGITPQNCRPLVDAGADFLAIVSGVWGHPQGPAAAIQAFHIALS